MARIGDKLGVRATNVIGVAARLFRTEPVRRLVVEEATPQLDLLGDLAERHLDVEALLGLARTGALAGLPALPPGTGS